MVKGAVFIYENIMVTKKAFMIPDTYKFIITKIVSVNAITICNSYKKGGGQFFMVGSHYTMIETMCLYLLS